MPDMRGVTIIVIDLSPERLRGALSIAAAQAALGGNARIFLQGEAVASIREPLQSEQDEAHANAGLPTLAILFDEALKLGVRIIACQSGLQLRGTRPDDFDARVEFGGLVSVMQSLGEDRLVTV